MFTKNTNPKTKQIVDKYISYEDDIPFLLWANPLYITSIEKHIDRTDWRFLARNPAAIHLLKENIDKIKKDYVCVWNSLCANPNCASILFKPDYEKMCNENWTFKRELAEYVFRPSRMIPMAQSFDMGLDEFIDSH